MRYIVIRLAAGRDGSDRVRSRSWIWIGQVATVGGTTDHLIIWYLKAEVLNADGIVAIGSRGRV